MNPILLRLDPDAAPPRAGVRGRVEVEPTLDQRLRPALGAFFERGERQNVESAVRNTDRTIGARLSSEIVRTMKDRSLGEDHLTLRLRGSAGQSLGAFAARGLKIVVDGDANDYVGKGLSGAVIVVRGAGRANAGDAIIGNTCLYGATSGALFAAGRAGGRFAVRNSGATAVVEGCLANGCEYMTGGAVVLLGPVGSNFGAGMTGGEAFVFDPENTFGRFANPDTILIGGADDDAAQRLKGLIERHAAETGSPAAQAILFDWARRRSDFRHIIAKEAAAQAAEQESLRRVEEAAIRPAFERVTATANRR